ncbi:unknown [Prevotella sp. CAG:5226]|nr:unknown [Prevotella sp. CAG:5226]
MSSLKVIDTSPSGVSTPLAGDGLPNSFGRATSFTTSMVSLSLFTSPLPKSHMVMARSS